MDILDIPVFEDTRYSTCTFEENVYILEALDLIPVSHTLTLGHLELIKFGVTVD